MATTPAGPPELLPGRSELEEATRWLRWTGVGLAALAGVVLAAALSPEARWVLIPVLAVPLFAAVVESSRAWFAVSRASQREREAGYTTVFGEGQELWQLEPRTGVALRRPGEPLISRGEARRRSREARRRSP